MTSPDDKTRHSPLPDFVKRLLWDCDPESVNLDSHPDFVIRRVMSEGGMEQMQWLRAQFGDESLREWLLRHDGARMDPRRLRFWALILDLPKEPVDAWVQEARKTIWWRRSAR